jgi:nucleoside-diphosphate-sugar epimerase
MRTVVLGGNRYIGRHLVEELARRGHEVTVFNSHESPLPPGVRRLHGDRRLPGVIEDVLGPLRDDFDAVFDNTSYQVSDLEPLIELFRGRIQHYSFTSSTAVYLWSDIHPVTEDFPVSDDERVNPARAYGAGKVRCERLLREEFEQTGFPVTSFRVGHTMGPHSPLPTREPVFFARLEQGRPVFVPGDGLAEVHFVHVDDVAACLANLLESPSAAGNVYNVAGPQFSSFVGYVRAIRGWSGSSRTSCMSRAMWRAASAPPSSTGRSGTAAGWSSAPTAPARISAGGRASASKAGSPTLTAGSRKRAASGTTSTSRRTRRSSRKCRGGSRTGHQLTFASSRRASTTSTVSSTVISVVSSQSPIRGVRSRTSSSIQAHAS